MKEEKNTWGLFKQLYKELPNKHWFILGIFFILGLSLTQIASSYFIKEMTNSAVNKTFHQFYDALTLLLVITFFEILFVFLRTRVLGKYSEFGLRHLRKKLSNKYNDLDMETFSSNHTGDYVSRATNDVNKVKNYLTNTFPGLIWNPITAVLALIYLLILSWKLTLISLGIIPLVFISIHLLSKPLASISKKLQGKLGKANSLIQDYIKGVEVSKAYRLEKVLGENYHAVIEDSVNCGKKIAKKRAFINSFSQLFAIIPFFITFFLGGYYVIENGMTVGGLLAFINLLNYITNPIINLPRLIAAAKVDLGACSRIFSMLDSQTERRDGNEYNLRKDLPLIEFKDVSFTYPHKEDLVLNKISFSIDEDESIALVGPSGSGKSTIIKLLLGYYQNYEGEILVSGQELRNWNLAALRKHLALVSQDTYLFPESIEENISYGKYGESIPFEKIQECAKIANADIFIETFQDKYQTPIGELGNRLSGGQKQRLSIARAVLKDSEILLLDEATSSLDNESESVVQEALERVMKDKTSIVIAHRLSTIKNVDRILVMNEGKIVEQGSHDTLLNNQGLYKSLYQKQMKNDDEGMVA